MEKETYRNSRGREKLSDLLKTDDISSKRRELLEYVIHYIDEGELKQGFIKRFFIYIDDLNLRMMEESEDYYARFISQMEREIDFSLSWPMATILSGEGFILKINPISFLFAKEKEAIALIKHEILHILLKHHEREVYLKTRYSNLSINLAMDISVNQYINHLPSFCMKISSLNNSLNLDLKINETLECYAEEIEKALKKDIKLEDKLKNDGLIDFNEVHDEWALGDDARDERRKEKLKSAARYSSVGEIPKEVKSLLKEYESPKVPWINIIKSALSTRPSGKRKTAARRNRRQPERLDLRGELSSHIPEIIVALDVSASITVEDIKDYFKEIISLARSYSSNIRVILCDVKILDDYEISSINSLRLIPERRGGTKFSPVFERLKKEGRINSLLIYFTDGKGEEYLKVSPSHETIFIVTGEDLSLKNPPGRVIYLSHHKRQSDYGFGLEAMRELLHEWAR